MIIELVGYHVCFDTSPSPSIFFIKITCLPNTLHDLIMRDYAKLVIVKVHLQIIRVTNESSYRVYVNLNIQNFASFHSKNTKNFL